MNTLFITKKLRYLFLTAVIAMCLASCASAPQHDAGYVEQPLMLDNGSYKVPGILVRPASHKDKLPVIVMLHGTASQKNEVGGLYQRLAVALAKRGYASLRIDFAGTGDSPVDYRLYTLTSAQRDATTALNYLTMQPEFDTQRMGVIGFSQGGLIAQLVASSDARIKAMVAWSSVAGNGVGAFQSLLFAEYYAEAQRNGFAIVHFDWRPTPLTFSLQWFDEVRNNTSLDMMASYHGKLLAIAGLADTTVPYTDSIKLIKAVGADRASLYLVKGANHLFNVLGSGGSNGLAADQSTAEEVLAVTTDWLVRQL